MKEVVFIFFLFMSVLFSPTWVVLAVSLFGILYFRAYIAVIALAFLCDALYFGGTIHSGAPIVLMIPLSVYAFLVSLLALIVRSRLREETI